MDIGSKIKQFFAGLNQPPQPLQMSPAPQQSTPTPQPVQMSMPFGQRLLQALSGAQNAIQHSPEPVQLPQAVRNIPVLGGLAQSIPNAFLNEPLKFGADLADIYTGQPNYQTARTSPGRLLYDIAGKGQGINQTLSDVAGTGADILNYVPIGRGEQAVKAGIAGQTFKDVLNQGIKNTPQAMLTLGSMGLLNNMAQNPNADILSKLKTGIPAGFQSAAIAPLFSIGLPAAGYAGKQAVSDISRLVAENGAQTGGIDFGAPVGGDLTPEQYLITKFKQLGLAGLEPDEKAVVGGMKMNEIRAANPNVTMGDIQQISQMSRGLPLLANFDDAVNQGNTQLAQRIAKGILDQPPGSPYDMYKAQFKTLLEKGIGTSQPSVIPSLGMSSFPSGNDADFANAMEQVKSPTGGKERGFISTVKQSPQATQPLKDLVSGTYDVKSNQSLIQAANARIMKDPVGAMQFATGANNDEATATAIQLVKQLTSQGDHQTAADIVNQKAAQLTEAGRTIQAASLFDSLSPEGVGQLAARTIQRYNETASTKIPQLTGEQLQQITARAEAIQKLPVGSREQDMARQNLLQEIGRMIPSSATSKVLGIWRAGLLTGPQTVTKIVTSHAAMVALEQLKNLPAAAADSVASLFTGKRSLTPTTQGLLAGGKQGTIDAFDNLFKGYEAPNSGGFAHDFKNQTNYGNSFLGKVFQTYVDGIGRLHGSLYKPFYGAAHLNSLYDQALTEARNTHLTGQAKNDFILHFVKNPSPEALATASRDAAYGTFQQKTLLGSAAGGLQRNLGPAGKILAPFTRIPSAILTDAVDYTPAGIMKSIFQAVQRGEFTQDSQRQLVQGIGRGITGTGIVALGAALYNHGLISLDRPTQAKEAAQFDIEGKKAQAIKVDGQWKNLAALGPLGHALGIGAYFAKGLGDNGLSGALASSTLGAAKVTLDQPYLTQISNLNQAVQQPQQKGLQVAKSLASSVVPTLSGTVARAIDPLQRETNTIGDAIATKIPLLRQTLIPRTDTLGNQMQRSGGVLQNLLDPFQSTVDTSGEATNNPVTAELGRLTAAGLSATPAKLTKNQTINGVKGTLTPEQLSQLNTTIGPQVQSQLLQLIQSPVYQTLTDEEKQNAITSVVTQVRKQVRGTIDLQGTNPQNPLLVPPLPTTQSSGQYTLVNPSGSVKKIDLSTPISAPQLTGDTTIDTKLISQFNTAVTTRQNNIIALYQAGQIPLQQAETMLNQLPTKRTGTRGRRLPSRKPPGMTRRLSFIRSTKLGKGTILKLPKQPTVKLPALTAKPIKTNSKSLAKNGKLLALKLPH